MSKIELAERLHSEYVKDNYVQVMLPYTKYAQIYGNNGLMFYQYLLKNIECSSKETARVDIYEMNRYINQYISDERNIDFPYSNIPCHSERVGLFKKINFTNQILDYEKVYFKINDGYLTKIVVYKDSDGSAIVHQEILNNISSLSGSMKVSRETLENYLKTGAMSWLDPGPYEYVKIFDLNGGLYDVTLEPEDYYTDLTRKELQHNLSVAPLTDRTSAMLNKMIWNLDESFTYAVLLNKKMIKISKDGKIKIDKFFVVRTGKDEYEIHYAHIPYDMDSLHSIKDRIGVNNIETAKEPKIKNRLILFK